MKEEKLIGKVIHLLNHLDGRGIVFENEDLVRKTLKEMDVKDWLK